MTRPPTSRTYAPHGIRFAPTVAAGLLLGLALSAWAQPVPVDTVWPAAADAPIGELGRGVGIVFTPDLSVDGNCRFYEALGFACFQSADWKGVLDGIAEHNATHPERRIRTLVLETHGTNGNGLKLQAGKKHDAPRSYISVGALQERVEPLGVEEVILSACNSGRLLRPSIYRKLNRNPGDKLFLPPTLGVIDASDDFDPSHSSVRLVAPVESHIESTIIASPSELGPVARYALRAIEEERGVVLPPSFAISDMLMQILTRDPSLQLRDAEPVTELSANVSSPDESERLFERLVALLDDGALRANARANLASSTRGPAAPATN